MTEIVNFRLIKVTGLSVLDFKATALVDIKKRTGFLFHKKTELKDVKIFKEYAGQWYFVHNGEYVDYHINDLERSYVAKNGDIFNAYE